MDPDPDTGHLRADVAAKNLGDADLAGVARLVLDADHPQRRHVRGIRRDPHPRLDQPVARRTQGDPFLGLANDQARPELVRPDRASDWTGRARGLERRHPRPAVELARPRRLVAVDPEPQRAVPKLVAWLAGPAGAPMREVVREPERPVEIRAVEVVLDDELV